MSNHIPIDDPYAKELLAPKWEEVEAYFGLQLPPLLKRAYESPDVILRTDFVVLSPLDEYEVECFVPIETDYLITESDLERFLPFARNSAVLYMIDPTERDQMVWEAEIGNTFLRKISISLAEFLSQASPSG